MRPENKRNQKSASGHGGPRPNQKACQILAIAVNNLVSESTARLWWAEGNGSLKSLLSAKTAKLLGDGWNEIPTDEQKEIFEMLRAKVEQNRKEGWTSRL